MRRFSEVVSALREEAGFASARSFFNHYGGAAFFGCTYRHYFNVETGKIRPNPGLLGRIMVALRLSPSHKAAREFVLAYLGSILEDEELLSLFTEVLSAKPQRSAPRPPLASAMSRMHDDRSQFRLSREQSDDICANACNYLVFSAVTNDAGTWTPKRLAGALNLKVSAVEKMLGRLVEFGILEKRSGGFACKDPNANFTHPRQSIGLGTRSKQSELFRGLGAKPDAQVARTHFVTRAPESDMRRYFFDYVEKAVFGSDVCSTKHAAGDSGIYAVEAALHRLAEF